MYKARLWRGKMINYQGKQCPICKRRFEEQDDIVVCPDCGTPYHRECYSINNKCIYENQHQLLKERNDNISQSDAINDINKNTGKGDQEGVGEASEFIVCPRCEHSNPSGSAFCNKCGYFLNDPQEIIDEIPQNIKEGLPILFDPMGGVEPNEEVDTVKFGDLAKMVKSNTPYYMSVFKRIKDNNKSKFNFSAFLFNGMWFLFRKQYKVGIPLTVLHFVILFYTSLIQYIQDVSKIISNFSEILEILSLLQFAVMLFCGFFANKIYFKSCIEKVKKIKEDCKKDPSLDYNKQLLDYGGTNSKIIFLLFLFSVFVSQYLPIFFLGGKL